MPSDMPADVTAAGARLDELELTERELQSFADYVVGYSPEAAMAAMDMIVKRRADQIEFAARRAAAATILEA